MTGFAHYFYCCLSQYTTCHMKVYPVFKPNDYFKKNHGDKWEDYVKIIREEIMRKSFDFELSDIVMDDKFEFKSIMKGEKKDEKK